MAEVMTKPSFSFVSFLDFGMGPPPLNLEALYGTVGLRGRWGLNIAYVSSIDLTKPSLTSGENIQIPVYSLFARNAGKVFALEKRVIFKADKFSPAVKYRKRADKIEWEHVMPSHAFGQSFREW